MKIELKNIEHFESMSEETFCFSANLYVDGKKIGAVSNRGHGGCHEYDFDMETVRQLNQWCKENLPKWSMDDQEYETDLELHISNLVADFLDTKHRSVVVMDDTCTVADVTDAKFKLADIFVELTGADPNDEQAYAEFCSEAEGFLQDWLEDWLEKHEAWLEKYGQNGGGDS